jgi:hypothetical protein
VRKLVIVLASLGLAACASTTDREGAGPQPAAAEVQKAIEEASVAVKKADEVGFAWRDSEKMIKDAKAAQEKGDGATALKLAKKAKTEGDLGYQQYLDQKNAGPRI